MAPRILQRHSRWRRASPKGGISWFTRELSTPIKKELKNALLCNMASQVQCGRNDTNTPTENLPITLPFGRLFVFALFPLQFSVHAVFLSRPLSILLWLVAHPPSVTLSRLTLSPKACARTQMCPCNAHTHAPRMELIPPCYALDLCFVGTNAVQKPLSCWIL